MTATPGLDSRITDRIRTLPMTAQHRQSQLRATLLLPLVGEKVWAYLTEPDKLATWSPIVPDRPLIQIGPALARQNPAEPAVDAEVLRAQAPTTLRHRWDQTEVWWQIEADGDGSKLELMQAVNSEEDAATMAAGWHLCFAVLTLRAEGLDVPRVVGQDALRYGWQTLREGYLRTLQQR